ncbi:MAG: hypothetical protein UX88_C0040G0002 [Candidatus Woesebacteria bacterium GW2011_GWC2_47_16]|uniref:Uncharacterized protein n=2 Tax=Candidatus Woeseibacteriota TaxID=1752722 RepID=A0A0G1S174_9BACT|nr:MAG: hypothetical protein UX88_C0040G0002 [Candidatus Woesebacteria bacterium GW2011_GWC2_47_16]OGM89110.1 MAG: hypothetical protein A2597_01540 [Candidatus Woesebacteria bacterium RIFOXYD1_FULL_46_19]HBP51439.1 hypothetical protein [Candidatus Shapirobacteria bacterium]
MSWAPKIRRTILVHRSTKSLLLFNHGNKLPILILLYLALIFSIDKKQILACKIARCHIIDKNDMV